MQGLRSLRLLARSGKHDNASMHKMSALLKCKLHNFRKFKAPPKAANRATMHADIL